ncbi:MAG TPA: hypothetical protein VL309_04330 [Vicinamibacterales bacterium]|nr:hypothetical protein [Vicinamibacterales bacterium]
MILFLHVASVLVLAAGLALEWAGIEALRRSSGRGEAESWLRVLGAVPRVSGLAMLVILVSGFYLGGRFGVLGNAWLVATYCALVVMAVMGGPLARPAMAALHRAAAGGNDATLAALRSAASSARLRASLNTRIVFGLAVVYLMVGKPDAAGATVVLLLAAALAAAWSLRRESPPALVERYQ